MTTQSIKISHSDTDIPGIFASKTEKAFGGQVSVLPNYAVLNSARRQSRRNDVEITVEADSNCLWTVYKVGRDYIMINAVDGKWNDLYEFVENAADVADFIEAHPALAELMQSLVN